MSPSYQLDIISILSSHNSVWTIFASTTAIFVPCSFKTSSSLSSKRITRYALHWSVDQVEGLFPQTSNSSQKPIVGSIPLALHRDINPKSLNHLHRRMKHSRDQCPRTALPLGQIIYRIGGLRNGSGNFASISCSEIEVVGNRVCLLV